MSRTDLEHEGLKGAVRFVRSEVYDIKDSNGKSEKVWVYTEEAFFNREGNRLSSKTLNAKSHLNDSDRYVYDSLQKLVEEKQYDEHGALVTHIVTAYTPGTGKILSETEWEYQVFEADGATDTFITVDSYRYNDLGLVSEVWRSEWDEGAFGVPRLYIRNVYEDSGRVRYQYEYRSAQHPGTADSSYQRLNAQGLILESGNAQLHHANTYDRQGQLLALIYSWAELPGKWTKHASTYDQWGNKTNTETTDEKGQAVGDRISSRYTVIDKKGNWREVYSFRNGKRVYFCKRTIEYY